MNVLEKAEFFMRQELPDEIKKTIVLCSVTGSQAYGFSGPESDADLTAVYIANSLDVLTGKANFKPKNHSSTVAGLEINMTAQELSRVFMKAVQGNGTSIETILSPMQIHSGTDIDRMQSIVRASFSRSCAGHYLGFFTQQRRKFQKELSPKSGLYAYKALLMATHLFKEGSIVMDVPFLAEKYDAVGVTVLIDEKNNAVETVEELICKAVMSEWESLEAKFQEIDRKATLPPKTPNMDEAEGFLLSMRLENLDLQLEKPVRIDQIEEWQ